MQINQKELEKLIRSLYKNADKELKTLLLKQMQIRGKLYNEIANIMLIYTIDNNVMAMSKLEQDKEMERLGGILKQYIQSGARTQISIISGLLSNTVKDTFQFYNYNANNEEIEKIVKRHYKNKHFSERVWENETEVAKYINNQINEFVKGKVDVNEIKDNLKQYFDTSDYNAKRLAYTEVARVQEQAFEKFAEEVGVKKVLYNAKLDLKTCSDCQEYDLKEFKFENIPELPRHPNCRCYFEIID